MQKSIEKPEVLKKEESGISKKIDDYRAGFWLRLFSLLADVILLRLFFQGLIFLFMEKLFLISRYTEVISSIFVFLYLWLLNGPLGKGQTIGKYFIGIRVIDYDAKPLNYISSLKRCIVELLPFYLFLIIEILIGDFEIDNPLIRSCISSFAIVFILANLILIWLSPLKQGFHDIFVKSIVVKSGFTGNHSDLEAKWSLNLINRKTRTLSSAIPPALICSITIFALLVFAAYKYYKSEEWKKIADLNIEMKEKFVIKDFVIVFPISLNLEKNNKISEVDKDSDSTEDEDFATSDTYYIRVLYKTGKDVNADELESDEEIQDTLLALSKWFPERLNRANPAIKETGIFPKYLRVEFYEYISLFLNKYEKMEASFDIPLEEVK
jgi:uncharacterized RDD family membrane protein YckC